MPVRNKFQMYRQTQNLQALCGQCVLDFIPAAHMNTASGGGGVNMHLSVTVHELTHANLSTKGGASASRFNHSVPRPDAWK